MPIYSYVTYQCGDEGNNYSFFSLLRTDASIKRKIQVSNAFAHLKLFYFELWLSLELELTISSATTTCRQLYDVVYICESCISGVWSNVPWRRSGA